MKKLILIILIGFSFWRCEKDDVCEDVALTTPRIVFEFYNFTNQNNKKNVTNLLVNNSVFTNVFTNFNAVSKVQIPLDTSTDQTVLTLNLNGGDTNNPANDNIDVLTLNYTREDVYVSRGCGYKTIFTLNDTNGLQLTTDSNNWIQNIVVENNLIQNEQEIHVKIYF
jgi:Family of unknown function (DUF6452)